MFERSVKWLAPYPDNCHGVDIKKLKADSKMAYDHLISLGPDCINHYDQSFFKPLDFEIKM